MEKIKWVLNQMPKNEDKNLAEMALDNVNQKVSPQLSTVLSNTISKA